MVKVVVVEGQILTEQFINKRIAEQYDYLMNIDTSKVHADRLRGEMDSLDKWESAKDRFEYFMKLKNKLKTI